MLRDDFIHICSKRKYIKSINFLEKFALILLKLALISNFTLALRNAMKT